MLKGRRQRVRSGIGVLAIGVAALAGFSPASASAQLQVTIEPRFQTVETAFLRDVGVDLGGPTNNQVVITGVTIGSNKDVVIGDTTGIVDPIPSGCSRVDSSIIRCMPGAIDRFAVGLKGGYDRLVVSPELDTVTDTLKMKISIELGSGADEASDGSEAIDRGSGGPGRDRIDTGPGADRVRGGAGVDRLWGGPGRDVLFGGGRNDLLFGQAGLDVMHGGPGMHDRCRGGAGRDFADGCEDVIRVR